MFTLYISATLFVIYLLTVVFCFGTTRQQIEELEKQLEEAAPDPGTRTYSDAPLYLAIRCVKAYKAMVEHAFGLLGLGALVSAAIRGYDLLTCNRPIFDALADEIGIETPVMFIAGMTFLCVAHWRATSMRRWLGT